MVEILAGKTDVFCQRCSCVDENLTRNCVTSLQPSLFRMVIITEKGANGLIGVKRNVNQYTFTSHL